MSSVALNIRCGRAMLMPVGVRGCAARLAGSTFITAWRVVGPLDADCEPWGADEEPVVGPDGCAQAATARTAAIRTNRLCILTTPSNHPRLLQVLPGKGHDTGPSGGATLRHDGYLRAGGSTALASPSQAAA